MSAAPSKTWTGNPYADLPSTKAEQNKDAIPKENKPKSKKRQLEDTEKQIKEWGWIKVPSQSHPGKFVFQNKYTKEKIGWEPDRAASKKRKELPPAPRSENIAKKKAKTAHEGLDPEEKLKKDQASLSAALGKIQPLFTTPPVKETDDNYKLGCKLLHKAFSSSAAMSGPTSKNYFDTLGCTQSDPEKVIDKKYRTIMKALFKFVDKFHDQFDKDHMYQLDTWCLRGHTHLQLFTDDTYQYNKAAKRFIDILNEIDLTNKKRIKELEGTEQDFEAIIVDNALLSERKQVVVEILPTLISQAQFPWAVATIKNLIKEITDRRNVFNTEQQRLIDEGNDGLQKKTKHFETDRSRAWVDARTCSRSKKVLIPNNTSSLDN